MITRVACVTAIAALALAGCERPDDQETGSLSREDVVEARQDLDPAFIAALDSGNTAYRAREYEEALRYFERATEADAEVAAGWFGVYMAQLALGNMEAADAAMERAQELAPGASLIHPEQPEEAPAGSGAGAGDTTP